MNRRSFFQSTTTAALATQVSFSALAAATKGKSAEEMATDEDFWMTIRNEFTTDRTVINMNNGYASPAPRTVQDAMKRYLDFTNMGPYHTMVMQLDPKIERARRMIADAAGCDPEEIAITRNSSEALEIAQLGVTLKPGDEVLTTNQDYPRMLTTFRQRVRREGIKLKMISIPVPVVSMDDLYQRFEQLGDFEQAAASYEKAVKINPSNYLTWANLASAWQWGKGGMERALPAYQKAIDLAEGLRKVTPTDAELLARLGSYYASLGEKNKSLPILRQALALDPENPNVQGRVGFQRTWSG